MAKAKPGKDEVEIAYVYISSMGFRYTCRNEEGMVIYDSPQTFRSRFDARKAIKRSWPDAKVSFEVK